MDRHHRQAPTGGRVGLQVERAELVDTDHHVRIIVKHLHGAVHQAVQVQDPVLLGLVVRVVAVLPGLQALKRHALLAEQHPKALVANVVDHPWSARSRSWP
jgi:hypothetical protein